jgi:hypothetical protein
VKGDRVIPGLAVEGAADYFFSRPLDANLWAREAQDEWYSWRFGWLMACWFEVNRGARERARWLRNSAA